MLCSEHVSTHGIFLSKRPKEPARLGKDILIFDSRIHSLMSTDNATERVHIISIFLTEVTFLNSIIV